MNRVHLPAAVLLVAALLACGVAHAQARGPSAEEILDHGQVIDKSQTPRESPWKDVDPTEWEALQAWQRAREQAAQEQRELSDPAFRARKLAELDAWFRRIPGRFRIEGQIKKLEPVPLAGAVVFTVVRDKVTGVADCTGIGEGVGVQCILSATWGIIDRDVPGFSRALPPPPSEMLRTINPAVLVLGLNQDPPGIRAHMVNAESLSHMWVGQLWEGTVWASRVNRALSGRNINSLQLVAEPESGVVTIVLRSGLVVITLTMHRDPEARAEDPIKTLRSR